MPFVTGCLSLRDPASLAGHGLMCRLCCNIFLNTPAFKSKAPDARSFKEAILLDPRHAATAELSSRLWRGAFYGIIEALRRPVAGPPHTAALLEFLDSALQFYSALVETLKPLGRVSLVSSCHYLLHCYMGTIGARAIAPRKPPFVCAPRRLAYIHAGLYL